MRIVDATLFALQIPFVEAFAHSVRSRSCSDSIVVRLRAEDGTVGYGEAVARPYVTGETVEGCLRFMERTLWPTVQATDYPRWPGQDPIAWLASLALPADADNLATPGVVAWHGGRCGFELALVDCLLKSVGVSLGELLPPRHPVTYSGVITASSVEGAVKHAKRFKQFGLPHVKVKITGEADRERLAAIRAVVGPQVSLRVDGNGAYSVESAIATCEALAEFQIDSAEQMIPRGNPQDLATVQAATAIPQMADESLITLADAEALIETRACQGFNLRLAKCGGLGPTLAIADLATAAGIQVQVGCQVGETAILSAAGRHLAAYLPEISFCEGSYGSLLLREDLSRRPIHFGHQGLAKPLKGPGLGVEIQDALLEKYAQQTINLPPKAV
ncbi:MULTISPECIES: enolase C-terminal domain-like protein [Cyanophyceae]|uniref:mandelate racemase/muconate lactonizing enzyme family protein n=1 Tax=Cyanophyceae TaxID=3028117 RepID=UPI00168389BD|nr:MULTISPECIES: enolase C-terminal domain-like protein [Cyanophyceae]MBD1915769.1 enolase [Phormidium sp. FACHB-77]MBD2030044.1 enolase [Phormidium sp. FACHB-322]MBD2052156.1 enolase [Leptolyngbya sp. FACHB-60]